MVALGLLGAMTVAGLVAAVREAHRARTHIAAVTKLPRDGNQIALLDEPRTRFIDFVRRIVPPGDQVRIIQPPYPATPATAALPPAACAYAINRSLYWWVVYELVPRASTCSASAPWTIYVGVAPPPGGTIYRFSPTYAVVHS